MDRERNNFIKLLCGGSEVAREAWHRPQLLEMLVLPGMYRAGRQRRRCGGWDGLMEYHAVSTGQIFC